MEKKFNLERFLDDFEELDKSYQIIPTIELSKYNQSLLIIYLNGEKIMEETIDNKDQEGYSKCLNMLGFDWKPLLEM